MSDRSSRIGSWLREPLLHFLVLGAGIFLLYQLVRSGEAGPQQIVVSAARVDALAENFTRTWMRAPTAQELAGLVDDYVKDEVYYREAVALGLDRDDSVVRRRLRQKLEFVSEDVAAAIDPTDEQLASYREQHAEQFVEPERVTFEQVFVSSEKRGDAARSDAEKLLAELRAAEDPAAAGDSTLLPASLTRASVQEIAKTFGDDFALALGATPLTEWTGPLASAFGLHLVRVSAREAAALPPLEAIRASVLREWQAEQRQHTNEAFYESLRSRYEVRVEGELGERLARTAPQESGAPVQ